MDRNRQSVYLCRRLLLSAGIAAALSAAAPQAADTSAKPAKAALLAVPLSFEANQGQTDSQVKFLSRGDGYSLFLT